MAKRIEGGTGSQVTAEPWTEGKVVVGHFISADTLPNCDSRKITLEIEAGQALAVWETAALARQVGKMTAGNFYRIKCLGKSIETKAGNKAWGFEVLEAENDAEAAEWIREYRAYVAGGGK